MWFVTYFIDFCHLSFAYYIIFMLYPNPKVLTTLRVVDFRRLKKSRGETLEQGYTFWFVFIYLSHVQILLGVFRKNYEQNLSSFSRS
jgi:hypothetical protein